jgi:hypothetical protein
MKSASTEATRRGLLADDSAEKKGANTIARRMLGPVWSMIVFPA